MAQKTTDIIALTNEISEQLVEKISESIVEKLPLVTQNLIDITEAAPIGNSSSENSVQEAARTTAEATKKAAWINSISAVVVAIVIAGSATGGTYLYFEPMKADLKKTKEQLQNFKSCFYYSEKQREFEAAMVKKAEEIFISKSKDKKARNAYFDYKTKKELNVVMELNKIPIELAYDRLKSASIEELHFNRKP